MSGAGIAAGARSAAREIAGLAADAIGAANAYVCRRDQRELAVSAREIVVRAAALPPAAIVLPIAAYLKLLSDALLLAAVGDAAKQSRFVALLRELALLTGDALAEMAAGEADNG